MNNHKSLSLWLHACHEDAEDGCEEEEEEQKQHTNTTSYSSRADGRHGYGDPGAAACQVPPAVQARVQSLASHHRRPRVHPSSPAPLRLQVGAEPQLHHHGGQSPPIATASISGSCNAAPPPPLPETIMWRRSCMPRTYLTISSSTQPSSRTATAWCFLPPPPASTSSTQPPGMPSRCLPVPGPI